MISIPGQPGSTCDGFSRREFLRVGGAGILGISLADVLRLQANAETAPAESKQRGVRGTPAARWSTGKRWKRELNDARPKTLEGSRSPRPSHDGEVQGTLRAAGQKGLDRRAREENITQVIGTENDDFDWGSGVGGRR